MTENQYQHSAFGSTFRQATFMMLGTGFDEIEALDPSMSCDVPGWRYSPSHDR